MKILLTNDDGIGARGIRVLCDFAETLGEVTVVAPKTEQSAKSHGINIHSEMEIKEVDFPGAVRAFAVDSTPADCVRFALLGLGEKFDLVLSGINCGLNIGTDIVYSGTVGAIFEAAAEGVPAVAVSTQSDYLDGVESH
ncbi:MAG: 5'/3'-nucleotidase SurE, partial [Eubacteriales bacterium]|nr:5'/3'-nucleotidase SurE [Eubacteriales bacterium]